MTSYLSPYSRAAVVAAALEYELECVSVLVFSEQDGFALLMVGVALSAVV